LKFGPFLTGIVYFSGQCSRDKHDTIG